MMFRHIQNTAFLFIRQAPFSMSEESQWPITDGLRKEYAFYVGDKRFDVLTNSYGVYTGDLEEYRRGENTDFTLKLVREIVESMRIEK